MPNAERNMVRSVGINKKMLGQPSLRMQLDDEAISRRAKQSDVKNSNLSTYARGGTIRSSASRAACVYPAFERIVRHSEKAARG